MINEGYPKCSDSAISQTIGNLLRENKLCRTQK
jgi:hypothetical protein